MSEEESVLELGYKVAEVVQEVVFRNQNHPYTCKMNRMPRVPSSGPILLHFNHQ